MIKSIDEAIQHCEEVAEEQKEKAKRIGELIHDEMYDYCLESVADHRQLAEWLRELKAYRKQIQNLIDNESFEIVNPFNTYEYARVVRVADLYDLIEVNADDR